MKYPKFLIALAFAVALGAEARANTIITQWDFEGNTTTPNIGSGTASNVGGTSPGFYSGAGGSRGWGAVAFAAQGTGSGTTGVRFNVSTLTYSNITVSFDHSSTQVMSRWAQVDYTLNGNDWVAGFWNNNGGLSPALTYSSFNVDFSSITGANNNASFGFRIVSIFSPLAFDQNNFRSPYNANSAYMQADAGAVYSPSTSSINSDYSQYGAWTFDNVTVSSVPEPSALSLLAIGLGVVLRRRRRTV